MWMPEGFLRIRNGCKKQCGAGTERILIEI
jgi:hypothetical protein